jgi:hypothetical protein
LLHRSGVVSSRLINTFAPRHDFMRQLQCQAIGGFLITPASQFAPRVRSTITLLSNLSNSLPARGGTR